MNITFFHDLDTGFLAATLKPAFQALGHTCTVMQTHPTYLEKNSTDHIDIRLGDKPDLLEIDRIFKETDLFIIRAWNDWPLQVFGITKYAKNTNTIFKVHGSELREQGVPYSLKTWRIDWHGKEPVLCGPRDPSLFKYYRQNTVTQIERPAPFPIYPKKHAEHPPFAIHTPTNTMKKGTQLLIDRWKSNKIPLKILGGLAHTELLQEKSKASYYIDRVGTYYHGPYSMNSVEAWALRIPVFTQLTSIDKAVEPTLDTLITDINIDTVQRTVEDYIPDTKSIDRAYRYARTTHDPTTIAQQYLSLFDSIHTTV